MVKVIELLLHFVSLELLYAHARVGESKHASVYLSIPQHTSAYLSILQNAHEHTHYVIYYNT